MALGRFSNDHSLRQRLLRDIEEIQRNPYPGIALHMHEDGLRKACLILTPEGEVSLHLTITFPLNYPLDPPKITIQSAVTHPNVYGSWICCNILRQGDGYTPAYSLKGICVQMLSFFGSDHVEQEHGENGGVVNRKEYAEKNDSPFRSRPDPVTCHVCGFRGPHRELGETRSVEWPKGSLASTDPRKEGDGAKGMNSSAKRVAHTQQLDSQATSLVDLPPDVLLLTCEHLTEEDLLHAACAFEGFARVISNFNILRTRELRCFFLKRNFHDAMLGVGVQVLSEKQLSSEFDFLSFEAYTAFNIRKSVQGLPFTQWLPLPLSYKHWQSVSPSVEGSLRSIAKEAKLPINRGASVKVILTFMNDIVVRLSKEVEGLDSQTEVYDGPPRSSLTHASDKAVEGYFHLFHLLVCIALADTTIISGANTVLGDFINGRRDKVRCPNLGHLLIQILLCDQSQFSSEILAKTIITEAITRNVVWMLDRLGAGMAELAYMESGTSHYRLQKTFEASKTSYRLLMFLNMMRQITQSVTTTGSTDSKGNAETVDNVTRLTRLRDHLFSLRGSPPKTFSASLIANRVRKIQAINDFPSFLQNMGLEPPTALQFSEFLRQCVRDSMHKGYSQWGLTQSEALCLRMAEEDRSSIDGSELVLAKNAPAFFTFFPDKKRKRDSRTGNHGHASGNLQGSGSGSRGPHQGHSRGRGGRRFYRGRGRGPHGNTGPVSGFST